MAKKKISYDEDGRKVIEVIAKGIINSLMEHALTAYDTDEEKKHGREQIIIEIQGLGEGKEGKINISKGSEIEIKIKIKNKD